MRRNGFTLVELLVVIAIIALLMGILMPALSKVRQLAFRVYCGTNLSGIGKAMIVYANDYDDELPRAGGPNAKWYSESVVWDAESSYKAYNTKTRFTTATVTSSLYLLVKYAEITPKSFICKSDSQVKEFKPGNKDITTLWDFGEKGYEFCSYSYHLPYCENPLTITSDPGLAIAADPNPWIDKNRNFADFNPDGGKEQKEFGNATVHQGEGQNVLFMDTHIEFAKVSFCGLNEDNIYTLQTANTDIRKGIIPSPGNYKPFTRTDSVLVDDRLGPKL